MPKFVVSNTLKEPLAWQNSTLIRGDVAKELTKLKGGSGKDIQVIGSGQLVDTLAHDDLVDEYRLMIHPIVMGGGKRLFRDEGSRARLRLVNSKPTSMGVLIVTYVPERA